MEPKMRLPRTPAPRHRRRSPTTEHLIPLPPDAPAYVVMPVPPRSELDEAMRARINDATRGLRFDATNIAFPAYAAMTPEERGRQSTDVAARNRAWIDAVFQATDADWFTVVDGVVTAASRELIVMPADHERWEEGERTGKVPHLFIAPRCLEVGDLDE